MRTMTAAEATKNGRAYVNLRPSHTRLIDECYSIRPVGAGRIQAIHCTWIDGAWVPTGFRFSVSPDRIVSIIE